MTLPTAHPPSRVGVVAIGRNEGERLERCLRSLCPQVPTIVYVDSGSEDDSVAFARSLEVHVEELDPSVPFTMARARNLGFAALMQRQPETAFVQFVDGDCEVNATWIARAVEALESRPEVGAVSGHRREIYRNASIYNRVADIEWESPVGDVAFCGGDVMMRTKTFRDIGGYAEAMIAGEDPEISVRIRRAGWKILKLDALMTRHDAAMTRFSQWWKRSVRSGHAYAEQTWMHGASPERHAVQPVRSNWAWGLFLPAVILAAAWPSGGWSLLLGGLYPAWMWRVGRAVQRRGHTSADAVLYGVTCMLGKFPMMLGQMTFRWSLLTGRKRSLIEYK